MGFKSIDDINEYFATWSEYDDDHKLRTIRDLRKRGELSKANYATKVEYRCPVHQFRVVRPCGMSSCPYHKQNPESHNCLLKAVHETKHGRLSTGDISNLLDIPLGRVNQLNLTSTLKIRKALLKDRLSAYQFPNYKYLAGHCINCEVSIHSEIGHGPLSDEDLLNDVTPLSSDLVLIPNKYGWCSAQCKKARPSWVFRLENEFGFALKHIFSVARDILGSADMVDDTLELERGTCSRVLST